MTAPDQIRVTMHSRITRSRPLGTLAVATAIAYPNGATPLARGSPMIARRTRAAGSAILTGYGGYDDRNQSRSLSVGGDEGDEGDD